MATYKKTHITDAAGESIVIYPVLPSHRKGAIESGYKIPDEALIEVTLDAASDAVWIGAKEVAELKAALDRALARAAEIDEVSAPDETE